MAPLGTIQLAGNTNAGPSEVELNTLAALIVARPNDFTPYGSYKVSTTFTVCSPSAPTSAAITTIPTNRIVFAMLNPVDVLMAIRSFKISALQFSSTARLHIFNLVKCSNYIAPPISVIDIGQSATGAANSILGEFYQCAAQVPVANKLRNYCRESVAEMVIPANPTGCHFYAPQFSAASATTSGNGCTFLMDAAAASTQAYTLDTSNTNPTPSLRIDLGGAGIGVSRVPDTRPIATMPMPMTGLSSASGGITNQKLIDQRLGEHPLILSANTGLELQWTSSSAFTSEQFDVSVEILWDELAVNW